MHPPSAVLDCTCGIGTQVLPLAALGYRMTGTDLSAGAVARAREEARARALDLRLDAADLRHVADAVGQRFDAVISCDNALPHLLTDSDLELALRNVRRCLRDDGHFLASVRDYDALAASRATGTPVTVHGAPGHRHGSGQAWRWSPDGRYVDITLFVLEELGPGRGWQAPAHDTTYRALGREAFTSALRATGFTDVRWMTPDETGYYQPVVTAVAG